MFNLDRDHAPFWVVDVCAIVGIVLFVILAHLDTGYGVGAILVILGFGQGSRALRASNATPANSMAPPALPSSGVVQAGLALAGMLGVGRHA